MSLKNILFYIALLSFTAIALNLLNDFFIFDWRIKRSEIHVNNSIQQNYKERKLSFRHLFEYCHTLPPFPTIEFEEDGNFIFRHDQPILVDSIVSSYPEYYAFKGDKTHHEFPKFLQEIKFSQNQLDSLRLLVEKVDCEAISFSQDSFIMVRYDGHSLHQYVYLYGKNLSPEIDTHQFYKKLDKNLYFGLNTNGLFCPHGITFDK